VIVSQVLLEGMFQVVFGKVPKEGIVYMQGLPGKGEGDD